MIVEVKDIAKDFTLEGGMFGARTRVAALRGVSFTMQEFETLGIVGESGSGKTTLAKIVAGLLEPDEGTVAFDRGVVGNFRKDVQIIFQNPYASLDPRMRIERALAEPLEIHGLHKGRRRERAKELLEAVGLDESALSRFPSQFSGGQRQRISIARALACEPKFLVLDEPVSSLDLTVQMRLLELLRGLKAKLGLTFIFISHNLGVIRYMADRVLVMHNGRVVEAAGVKEIFDRPREAYTRALLASARGA